MVYIRTYVCEWNGSSLLPCLCPPRPLHCGLPMCVHCPMLLYRIPYRDFEAGTSADVQITLRNDSSVDVRSVSVKVRRG